MKKTLLSIAFAAVTLCASAADEYVKTQKVWLSGQTHIFARMSYRVPDGTIDRGICYGTSPTPTTADKIVQSTAASNLSNNGIIYKISDLQPATVYYIRAYAVKEDGTTIYGEPVKAVTRPTVNGVGYTLNSGWPDEATETRVKNATVEAVDLWNEYTGINGLHLTVNYGSGTATADCSYGGWMRVGPNSSYQKTGTILHEALHAMGVGTHSVWNSSLMRNSSNWWLGPRATRAVRFLDNDTTAYLKGDGTHMWPYGINGAHEDSGSEMLYVGNSLICEALCEDGLPPTTGQFAVPGYVFEQDDNTKYYIKNEGNGTGTKFLTVNASNGYLLWKQMTAAEATADDNAAWYVTFDPTTCYYSLRNAATGEYMSYKSTGSNGIYTKEVAAPTATEKFHFLPSPITVAAINGEDRHGYWIAYVKDNSATALAAASAATSTATSATSLSFMADASLQRWLLLTADEVTSFNEELFKQSKAEAGKYVSALEALLLVPHAESVENATETFRAVVTTLRSTVDNATEPSELSNVQTTGDAAMQTFFKGVYATDDDKPFDITFRISNPLMESTDGWTAATLPSLDYSCGEYYEKAFDLYQTVTKLAKGKYTMKVQAFQRPGTTSATATDWAAGTDNASAYIYLATATNKTVIKNIMADAQTEKVGTGTESAANSLYVPNNMQATSAYFAKGLYENTVTATFKSVSSLKIGIKGEKAPSGNWAIFTNFRLYFYGSQPASGIDGVTDAETTKQQNSQTTKGTYTLSGQRVNTTGDTSALAPGLYIVNGKKVAVQ